MRLFLLLLLLSGSIHAANVNDSLVMTQKACAEFQAKLKTTPGIKFGTAYIIKGSSKTPIFWWGRQGVDSSYPPLVFLHGGPASNSWAVLDKWQVILKNYPGDFITFDHRGEGCSKTASSNLSPSAYSSYRVRNIVGDIEYLRKNVFHYKTWRVMGHSRGAAIVHYYLEMAPEAIESAHAMGFSIMPPELQLHYPLLRASGYARTAEAYLKKYPGDEAVVRQIRNIIVQEKMCWIGIDSRKICGPSALDVLGSGLRNVGSWESFHSQLVSMVDAKTIHETIEAQLLKDVYGHFNYIVGTNGQDFGNPDSAHGLWMKNTKHSAYTTPFLAEIRYVVEAIAANSKVSWKGSVDRINYLKVKNNLIQHPSLNYNLYVGSLDPIAPPEMYLAEKNILGPLVNLTMMNGVGHDGWFEPVVINNLMKKNY